MSPGFEPRMKVRTMRGDRRQVNGLGESSMDCRYANSSAYFTSAHGFGKLKLV